MKKYLIDQSIFLLIGLVILLSIPRFCGPCFAIVLQLMVTLCWGYLCRRILLLPFDFFIGSISRIVYYSSQIGIEEYEFFKNSYCAIWKFHLGKNNNLTLLVPSYSTESDSLDNSTPKQDRKIEIVYYGLSKILIDWNYI